MAEKAGVSVATISRVLNPETRKDVAPKTLEKIDQMIEKHGYAPNIAAKNLRKTIFKTIGVIVPHHKGVFFSDYYIKILSGVSDALLDTDYKFKMVMLKVDKKKWDQYGFQYSESIDGMLVTHWPKFFSSKSFFQKLKIPCVVINDYESDIKAYFVVCDNEEGGRLAALTFYSAGHRQVMVFTGHEWSSDSQQRLNGFKKYYKQKGNPISSENIVCAHFQFNEAYEWVKQNWDPAKGITAIFCVNDGMAMGVLKGLREKGVRCPKDVSVIGFDNEPASAVQKPPLTTIEQPVYEMAEEGSRILLEILESRSRRKTEVKQFQVQLVQRESVKII